MNPYQELGVGKDADDGEIKRAYRKRARNAHPDTGGSHEEMQRVNAAYKLLANPESRKHYDETGESEQFVDEGAQIANAVATLVLQVIEAVDVAHQDVIDIARNEVKKAIADTKTQRAQHQKAIAKRERALKRLVRRKPGVNRIEMMLEHEIAKMKAGLAQGDKAIEFRERMLAILDEYDYRVDEQTEAPVPTIRFWSAQ